MARVSIEKVQYQGWPNCYRVSDGEVELIATTDVGPRIIRFGFVGESNEFCEFEEQMGKTGGDEWRIYGGHRLWHSPESRARSYYPDNRPIEVDEIDGGIRLRQYTEPSTGIAKVMEIRLNSNSNAGIAGAVGPGDDGAVVTVRHTMTNNGVWPVNLALWALSVMAPGGVAVAPQTTRAHPEGLLPNRWLALWPYTDLTDKRLTLGRRFVLLRQDTSATGPCKFGLSVTDGWAAYANRGHLFLKRFDYFEGATYPDGGASVEVYTNERMLELETLSPLFELEPGDMAEHTETWRLYRNVGLPGDNSAVTEDIVEERILPLVSASGRKSRCCCC
ncbi:MAG: hypothetical protein HPY71_10620 [Firmicutes bacterium]|nr:hypothetical protein [Bacillota bacterium]